MRYYLSLIIILSIASCTSPEHTADKESDTKAILESLTAMWDAIEKGDTEAYAAYIHPDFSQFGETDSVLQIGKDVEVNGIREYFKKAKNVHTEMISPTVTINGNVAFITYYWQDHGIKDNIPFATHGKSTRIFVKENNQWLCIHGHYTLLPN